MMKASLVSGRPFLRWAGSKTQLIPHLLPFWNEQFHRYYEPFLGSGSLYYAIGPDRAVLSDLNADLIQVYQMVKHMPLEVYTAVVSLPQGKDNYYKIRAQEVQSLSDLDRAARFLYLNRYCFNGLFRTNRNGGFNVPYGANRAGRMPTWQEFEITARALRKARIKCMDFEEALANIDNGDFVYLDPPYAVDDRRVFRHYGIGSFDMSDIPRLASTLQRIDRCGAFFVLTYADYPNASQLIERWNCQRTSSKRTIASSVRFRRHDTELIISNLPIT